MSARGGKHEGVPEGVEIGNDCRSRPFEKAFGAGNLRVREMHASMAAAAVRY